MKCASAAKVAPGFTLRDQFWFCDGRKLQDSASEEVIMDWSEIGKPGMAKFVLYQDIERYSTEIRYVAGNFHVWKA